MHQEKIKEGKRTSISSNLRKRDSVVFHPTYMIAPGAKTSVWSVWILVIKLDIAPLHEDPTTNFCNKKMKTLFLEGTRAHLKFPPIAQTQITFQ